jgi:hypothetical protein
VPCRQHCAISPYPSGSPSAVHWVACDVNRVLTARQRADLPVQGPIKYNPAPKTVLARAIATWHDDFASLANNARDFYLRYAAVARPSTIASAGTVERATGKGQPK